MRTQYASGRNSLPAPIVNASTGGSIAGNGNTYFFFIQARNRVGYNQTSLPTSVVIPNSGRITISSTNFSSFVWEDWRHFVILVSTTASYSDARVIYRQELFEEDQITPVNLQDVVISANFVINNPAVYASDNVLPTSNIPEGYRAVITDRNKVFEYFSDFNGLVDNLSILPGNNANSRWVLVNSNSLRESVSNSNRELIEVTSDDLIEANLDSFATNPVSFKYWIENNQAESITVGRLYLNEYSTDASLELNFLITILGYVNLSNNVLITNNIDNVGIAQSYKASEIVLTTPLPPNHAYVFAVEPDISTNRALLAGTFISLYPLLVPYTTFEGQEFWAPPVNNLSDLKSLQLSQFFNGQSRHVFSTGTTYIFNISSSAADNGSTVIEPNAWTGNGRWLAQSPTILDGSITPEKLSQSTLDLLDSAIKTTTINIPNPTNFELNLNTSQFDYYIIDCPNADAFNTPTVLNFTKTLEVNSSYAVLLEIRQKTSIVNFDSSFLFPGGVPITLTGNTKNDLVLLTFVRSTSSTIKKRAILVQRDIG